MAGAGSSKAKGADKEPSSNSKYPKSFSKPEPTTYRYIPEGSGGTYTITPNDIQYVGTSKCNTCVAVYWRVDNIRCFFAHINVDCVNRTTGRWSRRLNPEREAVIKQSIKDKLDAEQASSNWGPITDNMRSSLVLTCLQFRSSTPKVGDAIVAAVLEWFGVGEVREINRRQAFIVDFSTDQATFFDIEAPTSEWFMQVEPENKAWAFVIEEVDEKSEQEL